MAFEIVKSLAIPAMTRSAGTREAKYPFSDMEVGDAFVEADVVQGDKVASRLQAAITAWRKRNGGKDAPKFSVRRFTPEGAEAESVGVWRIA